MRFFNFRPRGGRCIMNKLETSYRELSWVRWVAWEHGEQQASGLPLSRGTDMPCMVAQKTSKLAGWPSRPTNNPRLRITFRSGVIANCACTCGIDTIYVRRAATCAAAACFPDPNTRFLNRTSLEWCPVVQEPGSRIRIGPWPSGTRVVRLEQCCRVVSSGRSSTRKWMIVPWRLHESLVSVSGIVSVVCSSQFCSINAPRRDC